VWGLSDFLVVSPLMETVEEVGLVDKHYDGGEDSYTHLQNIEKLITPFEFEKLTSFSKVLIDVLSQM
jgi:hypothetical protein